MKEPTMKKRTQFSLWYFAAAILAVLVLQDLWVGALGYTIQRPTEERYLMTREELENRMAALLPLPRAA
jgi:ATP-dependent Zn protease